MGYGHEYCACHELIHVTLTEPGQVQYNDLLRGLSCRACPLREG